MLMTMKLEMTIFITSTNVLKDISINKFVFLPGEWCPPDFQTMVSTKEKILNDINVVVCRHVIKKNSSLPVTTHG